MNLDELIKQDLAMKSTRSQSNEVKHIDIPEKGLFCTMRFTTYVETGSHKKVYNGTESVKPQVMLGFDIFGPQFPVKEFNGEKTPTRVTFTESNSTWHQSNLSKLFSVMKGNDKGVQHMAQLVGRAFKGRVFSEKFTYSGKEYQKLTLKGINGYTIDLPIKEEDGSSIDVPEQVTKPMIFLWNVANKEMWDNIYIGGQYPGGKSKNVFQEKIKEAENFKGSKIDTIVNGLSEEMTQEIKSRFKRSSFVPKGTEGSDPIVVSDPVQDFGDFFFDEGGE